MIANYLPIPDIEQAPEIIKHLREAFDHQLEALYKEAMRIQENDPDAPVDMVHVHFRFAQYDVEVMYDRKQDLFTQLVARPIADRDQTRPSYTISLFLVGRS